MPIIPGEGEMTFAEVAATLQVSERYVHTLALKYKLPVVVRIDDLNAWLETCRTDSVTSDAADGR